MTAPSDRTTTSQATAKMNSPVHWISRLSNAKARPVMARQVTENWIAEPDRRSISAQNRFWYRVPAVMPSSAMAARPIPVQAPAPTSMRLATTRTTPTKPSSTPSHWRGVTRSFNSGPTTQAVNAGCRPTIKALNPADSPASMAAKTPPR